MRDITTEARLECDGSGDGDLRRRHGRRGGDVRHPHPAAGPIFALLYLQPQPMSLEDIADAARAEQEQHLGQHPRPGRVASRSGASRSAGSRKDHYEAATDFWRLMQRDPRAPPPLQRAAGAGGGRRERARAGGAPAVARGGARAGRVRRGAPGEPARILRRARRAASPRSRRASRCRRTSSRR